MDESTLNKNRRTRGWRWLLALAGLALLMWQFLTFLEVVQAHTDHAQQISRSAGWSGHPVGTMAQPVGNEEPPTALDPARIMHTALPWSD